VGDFVPKLVSLLTKKFMHCGKFHSFVYNPSEKLSIKAIQRQQLAMPHNEHWRQTGIELPL
jgi:hypothetical protein